MHFSCCCRKGGALLVRSPNSLQLKTFLRRKATLKSISAPTARALSSDDVVRGREDELAVGFYYTSNAFYFSASVVLYIIDSPCSYF